MSVDREITRRQALKTIPLFAAGLILACSGKEEPTQETSVKPDWRTIEITPNKPLHLDVRNLESVPFGMRDLYLYADPRQSWLWFGAVYESKESRFRILDFDLVKYKVNFDFEYKEGLGKPVGKVGEDDFLQFFNIMVSAFPDFNPDSIGNRSVIGPINKPETTDPYVLAYFDKNLTTKGYLKVKFTYDVNYPQTI